MKVTLFGKEISINNNDAVDAMNDAIYELDVKISTIEEIALYKNEISFIGYGYDYAPVNHPKDELQIFYFDIKERSVNNGGDNFDIEVDWPTIIEFYKEYASAHEIMINAIDHNQLIDAMAIHSRRPDILPSLSDSFYARWLVKTNNIKFLEWAKSVDDNIDFSDKNRFENPLKIAIGYKFEDVAIWLIDNYSDMSLKPKSGNPLQFILQANDNGMYDLVEKMRTEEMMSYIMAGGNVELLPPKTQEIFIF